MSGENRVLLPGLGLPLVLDDAQKKKLFPTALDDPLTYLPLTALREFTMMRLMDLVTDKPDWDRKVNDPEIVAKWRAEALGASDKLDTSERMVDCCIAELRHKAKLLQEYCAVSVFTGDVVKSDTILPDSLRLALIEAVRPLEDVPPKLQDWHPRSDDTVLDLVHPSLYPLVYGRSRVLTHGRTTLDDSIERCGQGEVIPVPGPPKPQSSKTSRKSSRTPRRSAYEPYSDKFQWLPCEVDISDDGTKITSYINNLHPHHHKELYGLIEQVISAAIPLWNMTLSPTRGGYGRRIKYSYQGYESDPESEDSQQELRPEEDDGDDDYLDVYPVKRIKQPEPSEFFPDDSILHVNLREEYAKTGLQVIVKLANIVLTPEKPSYEGGAWHVEGQLNEHICATALYYYDNENVTGSHLAFRQRFNGDDALSINDPDGVPTHYDWLPGVFGCTNMDSTVQDVGQIETKQGRLLTFPNLLQHQVQPFKLADPTKPGHRKLLALFLVDPNVKIISTANVPCQRIDWWKDAIHNGPEEVHQVKIPVELQEQILADVEGFPLSMEEAKKLRLQLMDERSIFTEKQDNVFHSGAFSLCEH
ncbi:hypothetical protein BDN72DRAFT_491378 [Pluteus cervinus]|uniref:Uncharacterized protein n=1 Tax=Pluteus cervinus TaxID=181527 RepID=A0ACD3AZN2_9AGAR|nr:hypothetical protein BDN72DRAFT_491378 [Pluteus cervinus]